MPSNQRKQSKVVDRPKTRKELRKGKRLQKKANRVHYHKKKKELKIEYRERLKLKKSGKTPEPKIQHKSEDEILDDALSGDEDVPGSDEEIESDFELSDEEMEQKFQNKSRFVVVVYPNKHLYFLF